MSNWSTCGQPSVFANELLPGLRHESHRRILWHVWSATNSHACVGRFTSASVSDATGRTSAGADTCVERADGCTVDATTTTGGRSSDGGASSPTRPRDLVRDDRVPGARRHRCGLVVLRVLRRRERAAIPLHRPQQRRAPPTRDARLRAGPQHRADRSVLALANGSRTKGTWFGNAEFHA